MDELLAGWRDSVFNERHRRVPATLAAKLTEMAGEVTAAENIAAVVADARGAYRRSDMWSEPPR